MVAVMEAVTNASNKKKKLKLGGSGLRVESVSNSLANYDAPLQRNEEWRLRRLKVMRRHEKHSNFNGVILLE